MSSATASRPKTDRVLRVEGLTKSFGGDDVVHDPLLQRGFSQEPMFALVGITGVWPNGAWLSTIHPSGRSGFTKLWSWDGKRWASRQSTSESRMIMGIRPWIGGRMLAIEYPAEGVKRTGKIGAFDFV